jgi:hypothetical protein
MTANVTREQVMDALLAFLRADAGVAEAFPTISRRFLMWQQVNEWQQNGQPLRQPALFLYDGVGLGGGTDHYDPRSRGTPKAVTLRRTIVIYAKLPEGGTPVGPDSITPGGTLFHPLIEAVEFALNNSDSEGALTLGGLVSHCWLDGDGVLIPGELDPNGQGMATLPIRILMWPIL